MPYFGDGANLSGISAVVKKVRTVEDTGTIGGNYSSYTNVLNIPSFTPDSTNSVFLIIITIGNFFRSSGSGNACITTSRRPKEVSYSNDNKEY